MWICQFSFLFGFIVKAFLIFLVRFSSCKSEFVFLVLSKYHRSAWSCVFSPAAGKCSIKQPGMASLSCVGPIPGSGSDLEPCWVGSVRGNASAGNAWWWDEVLLLHNVMNTISWSKVPLAIPALPDIPRPFSSFCCQDQAFVTRWRISLIGIVACSMAKTHLYAANGKVSNDNWTCIFSTLPDFLD